MSKKLTIDDNYYIDLSDLNNCVLTFSESRIREKKTGETEEYTFEDSWYYPNVVACLKKYLELSQKEAKDVKECIEITEKIFEKLKSICK